VPDCPFVVVGTADDDVGAAAAELSAVLVGLAARGFVPAERACKVTKGLERCSNTTTALLAGDSELYKNTKSGILV
jgi:hypothetical protein